jgi:hypothetical protein
MINLSLASYTKWIYDLGQRCEVVFYQGDLQKSLRSIGYGIIFLKKYG